MYDCRLDYHDAAAHDHHRRTGKGTGTLHCLNAHSFGQQTIHFLHCPRIHLEGLRWRGVMTEHNRSWRKSQPWKAALLSERSKPAAKNCSEKRGKFIQQTMRNKNLFIRGEKESQRTQQVAAEIEWHSLQRPKASEALESSLSLKTIVLLYFWRRMPQRKPIQCDL